MGCPSSTMNSLCGFANVNGMYILFQCNVKACLVLCLLQFIPCIDIFLSSCLIVGVKG